GALRVCGVPFRPGPAESLGRPRPRGLALAASSARNRVLGAEVRFTPGLRVRSPCGPPARQVPLRASGRGWSGRPQHRSGKSCARELRKRRRSSTLPASYAHTAHCAPPGDAHVTMPTTDLSVLPCAVRLRSLLEKLHESLAGGTLQLLAIDRPI